MKKLILPLIVGLLALIPGDSSGYPHGRPVAYRPAAVYHTPAFVAVAPVYRAPVVAARPAFAPRAAYVAPGYRGATVVAPGYRGAAVARSAVVTNPALVSRGVYVSRPTGIYRPGYASYHNYYAGWHYGYWNGWYTRPWLWFGAGTALGATAGWLYPPGPGFSYFDPYYVAPPIPSVYDYSQPLPCPAPEPVPQDTFFTDPSQQAAAPAAPQGPPPPSDENAAAAARMLDEARQAFAAKDYDKAQQLIDAAVARSPGDATLHEFRALVLFARQKYQEAAGTIYSVLAVGPGWDWATLKGLYADPATYTAQLRALENFAKANPNDAASRFLLAYQYLVIDARDAAIQVLHQVVVLQPRDQLAAHLLDMLEKKPDLERPAPGM